MTDESFLGGFMWKDGMLAQNNTSKNKKVNSHIKPTAQFNIGSELDKQIYKEGTPTWGLKEGFLDVEDVKDFIKKLKKELPPRAESISGRLFNIIEIIDKIAGEKLI